MSRQAVARYRALLKDEDSDVVAYVNIIRPQPKKRTQLTVGTVDGGQWFTKTIERLFDSDQYTLKFIYKPTVKPDLIVYSQFGNDYKTCFPETKRIFISGELLWHDKRHRAADLSLVTIDYPRTTYLPMYVSSMWERKKHVLNDLIGTRLPVDGWKLKTKFCAFLYTNCVAERESFFHELSKYKPVTALGKSCNVDLNFKPVDRYIDPPGFTLYDSAADKYGDYKFIICFENTQQYRYITEKAINGRLGSKEKGGGIVIYCGASDVNEHFNPKAFVNATGCEKDWSSVIEQIIELDQNPELYANMWNEPFLLHTDWFNNGIKLGWDEE